MRRQPNYSLAAAICFALAVLIAVAAWGQEQCLFVDFEEFDSDVVVTESMGVTFTPGPGYPGEFRTFPADCTAGVDCPCDDDDLSFPGQGNILIKQESDSQCTPDDDRNGALFQIDPPWVFQSVSGKMFDIEEGDNLVIYLDGDIVHEGTYPGGDNELVPWSVEVIGDFVEIECLGTCAVDDLEFCEIPPVPAMPWWALGLTALLMLSGAAWWLRR